jgi:hypothetical protein
MNNQTINKLNQLIKEMKKEKSSTVRQEKIITFLEMMMPLL